MPPTQLALIADDLTGALDSAAPFALAGYRTLVATGPRHLAATLAEGPEVVAVSLGSREGTAEAAAARATEATVTLAAVPRLFKKIDSRMKGHIAAEVRAILMVRGLGQALLCPAIPELGRIVQDGALRGAGVAAPIPVRLEVGLPVLTPDAATPQDLDRIVTTAREALLVGARGLAAALARTFPRRAPAPLPSLPLPLAFVVGSRDPISLAQVERLEGLPRIACPDGLCPPLPQAPALVLQATPGIGATGPEVAARLAEGAARLNAGTLVLTGGETAAATLEALDIPRLELLGEVETGLPLSRAPGQPLILTKSGGFGDADCLLRLIGRTSFIKNMTR